MRAEVTAGLTPSDTVVDSRYYLAPAASIGWLAGIGLASSVELPAYAWLLLSLPLTAGAVAFWRRGRLGLILAACAALAMGGWRYAASAVSTDPDSVHYHNGAKDVVVRGWVSAEPERGDTRLLLRVAARELEIDGRARPVDGVIQAQTGLFPAIPYGATVQLTGDLDDPSVTSSPGYAAYLARRGVRTVMSFPEVDVLAVDGGGSPLFRALLALKARGRAAIYASLPEPHASLLAGILLGDDSGMPAALEEAFRRTGMTHIIAISGFNIAVIIGLLDVTTAPLLPRRTAAVAIMIAIAAYAVLVGASASVVRALLMGIVYLTGLRLLGRSTLALAGLFTAAFLMTLIQPTTLWDVGFQLSFAATLGLVLYAGPWSRRLSRGTSQFLTPNVQRRVSRTLSELIVVTLAAQVLTLPLLLYHFGRLSTAGLPANVLVLPVQPAVMTAGGLTMLLGMIAPQLGQVAGPVAWLFLDYTIDVIELLARMPGASVPFSLSAGGLVVVYVTIGLVTLAAAYNKNRPRAAAAARVSLARLIPALAALAIAALLLIAWVANRPDGRLHIAFLDVGQGDAILITTPNDRQLLIDGGRSPATTLDQLGRQMPFWDRSIDLVIATHPDADHVTGLVDVVQRYEVARLITNGADAAGDTAYAALLAAAVAQDTPVHPAQIGEVIIFDDGVRLEILHTATEQTMSGSRNDGSVVARLTYGDLSVLLTGDAESEAEAALLATGRPLAAVVLKAGHHGANTSSSAPFLRAVSPRFIVISAGRDNDYGHPHPDMLERAVAAGATILRTDEMGTVELATDGEQMWWTADRLETVDVALSP